MNLLSFRREHDANAQRMDSTRNSECTGYNEFFLLAVEIDASFVSPLLRPVRITRPFRQFPVIAGFVQDLNSDRAKFNLDREQNNRQSSARVDGVQPNIFGHCSLINITKRSAKRQSTSGGLNDVMEYYVARWS